MTPGQYRVTTKRHSIDNDDALPIVATQEAVICRGMCHITTADNLQQTYLFGSLALGTYRLGDDNIVVGRLLAQDGRHQGRLGVGHGRSRSGNTRRSSKAGENKNNRE